MHKVFAALGLAVAVPVALAAPALAKPPAPTTSSVSSVLRQHEGFRAEVTYRCTGPKGQEGVIAVSLQQPSRLNADNNVYTVATAREEAKCDGEEREETIKIPLADGAVHADQTVRLHTTLLVNGNQVALDTSPFEPVTTVSPEPSPSPTSTQSASSFPSPSPTESETETATPSPSPTPTESETETATPSPSPTATS